MDARVFVWWTHRKCGDLSVSAASIALAAGCLSAPFSEHTLQERQTTLSSSASASAPPLLTLGRRLTPIPAFLLCSLVKLPRQAPWELVWTQSTTVLLPSQTWLF